MTDYHDYNTPEEGATDWHVPLNENFEEIDRDVEIRDEEANRSNYTPKAGAKFLATDTEAEFLGDGSEWQRLATSGKSPSFDSVETGELRQTTDSGGTRRTLLDTATSEDGLRYDSGKLPKFDAYEVNFSVSNGLTCKVNNEDAGSPYEYLVRTTRSGELVMREDSASSWPVVSGVSSGTLLVHGPKVSSGGHDIETTATVTATSRPSSEILESGGVETTDPVRSLQLTGGGGGGKLNVYGVDFVR